MLSFNEISNFPVLPWETKIRKKEKKNLAISPQTKVLKMWHFCTLQKGLKLAAFSPSPIYSWSWFSSFTEAELKQEVV